MKILNAVGVGGNARLTFNTNIETGAEIKREIEISKSGTMFT